MFSLVKYQGPQTAFKFPPSDRAVRSRERLLGFCVAGVAVALSQKAKRCGDLSASDLILLNEDFLDRLAWAADPRRGGKNPQVLSSAI
jgi:hypothetical protein